MVHLDRQGPRHDLQTDTQAWRLAQTLLQRRPGQTNRGDIPVTVPGHIGRHELHGANLSALLVASITRPNHLETFERGRPIIDAPVAILPARDELNAIQRQPAKRPLQDDLSVGSERELGLLIR